MSGTRLLLAAAQLRLCLTLHAGGAARVSSSARLGFSREHSNATSIADSSESRFKPARDSANCSGSYSWRLGGGTTGSANPWPHLPILYFHGSDGPHGLARRPRHD